MTEPPQLRLLDFVQAVFERPLMYTAYGSYNEVVAFLQGYHVGHWRPDTRWLAFNKWLEEHVDAGDGRLLMRFRKGFDDDDTALHALYELYDEYLQRQRGSAAP